MKKELLTAIAIAALLLSLVAEVKVGEAQSLTITIQADGSINPSTAPIQKVGNIYKLTASLHNNPLVVEKNGAIIDGGGFSFQGPGESSAVAINLTCTNTTVRNFKINGWEVGILGVYNGNTIINNTFTGNARDISIYADNYTVAGNYIERGFRIVGKNNLITQNQINALNYSTCFWITSSSEITISANNITFDVQTTTFISGDYGGFRVYHNNFLKIEKNTGGAFLLMFNLAAGPSGPPAKWDNGYPSGGNYWSDYATRYPNATEIDNTGIGNTAYVSDKNAHVIDPYPLMAPFNLTQFTIPAEENPTPIESPSPSPSLTTTPSPSPTPSISPSPSIPEFQSWIILPVALIALSVIVAIRRKKLKQS